MSSTAWRSLRTRIILLAIVTCVFLAIAAASFYGFLRSSRTATLRLTEQHLQRVSETLRQAYLNQAPKGIALQDLASAAPPRSVSDAGPNPPPPPGLPPQRPPPPLPPVHPSDPLAQLTGSVLQREDGVEGGFLAGAGPLVGYAFPTHEGPGIQKEMPQRELPTIDRLAHEAEASAHLQTFTYEGQHDLVLFVALPVSERFHGSHEMTVTGAVWLMQRLPNANSGRIVQLLYTSLGFAIAAIITALLAFFVTFEISGGVNAIMRRLGLLEHELAPPPEEGGRTQLAEFEKVLNGIDVLALSLKRKIESERFLEAELRHRERLSALGQFAAGIAHELRNPLATIRLRAQMSQPNSPRQDVGHHSDIILEEVDRLDKMIGKLLYFSRSISLELKALNLNEFLNAVAQSWTDRSLSQGVSVVFEHSTNLMASVDRDKLLQVLNNLTENAVQSAALKGHGTVVIKAFASEQAIQIDIIDDGPGFSGASLLHALDPFFTTRETGTGLGLSIAFELVQAHGGDLSLAQNPAGGAIVSIRLPQLHLTDEATL